MAIFIVLALAALMVIAIVFRLDFYGRRIYETFNGPLPKGAPRLQCRVKDGQDPIAVALALQHAGCYAVEHSLHGDTILDIAVHTGSAQERESIRSMIFDTPTLEGPEWHPRIVVFLDDDADRSSRDAGQREPGHALIRDSRTCQLRRCFAAAP